LTCVDIYVYCYAYDRGSPRSWSYDAHVPNRTIYVSDDDQPLYSRAQELAGGNLSAAISNALRRYVEVEDARSAGFDDVVVKVGLGAGRKVRFSGVLLGEWFSTEGEKVEHYRVFRGPKRFALHIERTPQFEMRDSQGNPLTGWRAWTGIGMASGGGTPAEATLDVFDTLDDLREHIPAELFEMVSASVKQPFVEELDI
jgi:EXLDI family protein